MRNRTEEYLARRTKGAEKRQREAALARDRIRTYVLENGKSGISVIKKRNLAEKNGMLQYLIEILGNYTEASACAYTRSLECSLCCRLIYLCGVNCKACGSWICSSCMSYIFLKENNGGRKSAWMDKNEEAAMGIAVCMRCKHAVIPPPAPNIPPCSKATVRCYKLLNAATLRPNKESLQQILLAAEIPPDTPTGTPDGTIRQNITAKAKIALCNWYVCREKEEKSQALLEQIEYLKKKQKESPEHASVLEECISDILMELSACNAYHSRCPL